MGLTFVYRPQLTHHSITFCTRNSCQDLQQAVNALLSKGAIERVLKESSLGFYSQLFLVLKKTWDLRPVIDLSTLNRLLVVLHFTMETQVSVRGAARREWIVSIDIREAYGVKKYLQFRVNKRIYQFTCPPFGLATSPREFTKLLRPVVAWLRQRGVELHVYFWLIHAESPKQAQLHAEMTITIPAARMGHQFREVGPNTQPGLPIPWNAVQHSTVHIGAPAENASQDPVGSSARDDEPCHHSPRSAQVAGHGGVYGTTCTSWKVAPLTSPVVGHHSMMPEDRELVWQDHSSSVGSTGGGLVGISSSPARSSSRHPGNGSHFLHGCVQLGLGSPTRLMLNTRTVVCISKIVAHTHSGDAGHHQAPEWISVPGIAHGSSSTGIEPSRTSWEAIYGSWRLLKRLTHKQTETMKIESQPMKSECCQDYGLTTVR